MHRRMRDFGRAVVDAAAKPPQPQPPSPPPPSPVEQVMPLVEFPDSLPLPDCAAASCRLATHSRAIRVKQRMVLLTV
jgi:hypothetical protein